MTSDYCNRLDPRQYEDDPPVEISARRGRAPAVVAEHSIPERLFARAVDLGRAYDLHLLPVLDPHDDVELTAAQARTLADELSFLRTVVNDPALEGHLAAAERMANTCWRSAEGARLTILGS